MMPEMLNVTVRPEDFQQDDRLPVIPLEEPDTMVTVEMYGADGRALWIASSTVGHSRLHADVPAEILARTHGFALYFSQGPQGSPADVYTGTLACGCGVRFTYRPGITAHCPQHGAQPVRHVLYPTQTQEISNEHDPTT